MQVKTLIPGSSKEFFCQHDGRFIMAEAATKIPTKIDEKAPPPASKEWRPLEALHQQIDRLFDDFGRGPWRSPFGSSKFDLAPFRRGETTWSASPAVDIVEKDKAYEITAELPGMDENNIEVKLSDGELVIKGEKKEEKEEKKKDYYLSERRYGSFERRFTVPKEVDAEKVGATFKNGVLTVTLPKSAEAQKAAKTITVKAA
jgi:HSP20 family protein